MLAVLGMGWAPARAANLTIMVGDNFYDKKELLIKVGDVVTWSYTGSSSHPTASDSSPAAWATFPLNSSSPSFTKTFDVAGVYPYHCTIHGGPGSGMSGTITVTSATPTATEDARLAALALSLFPNPSRGYVTVQLRQRPGPDYQLRISNVIGQEIRSVGLHPDLSAAGLPLNLTDLPGGVYFYSLLVDGKVASTKRLILQN